MATIGYPELTPLNHEFVRALTADKKPLSDAAYLWYQGIEFDRNAREPSATTRGHQGLCYLHVNGELREQGKSVPGQNFAKGQTPKEVCSALISKNAADWEGPFQINFRYDRNDKGIWSGSYSIETSAQHRDIVAGRKEYDKAIAAALGATWEEGAQARSFAKVGGDKPGFWLVVRQKTGALYLKPDPALQQAWDGLLAYLKGKGVREIYSINYELTKPNSRLIEGDTVKLIYAV